MAKRKTTRKRTGRGFILKCLLAIHLILASLLLFSYLSPSIDPKSFWPVAMLGIAYLPLVFLNLIFALIWLIFRPAYALISVLAIVVGWNALTAHVGLNFYKKKAETTEKPTLRVLSYNVHLFKGPKRADNLPDIKEEALELIEDVSPDVVCIQEFYTRNHGPHNTTKAFRNVLGLQHQFVHSVAKSSSESYGMAIFSKYPIVGSGRVSDFEQGVNSVIYADIDRDGQIFRVYNVHLRSFGFQKEDYDFINKPGGSFETNVSSTRRIGGRMRHAFTIRSQQARSLKEHIEQTEIPLLVMGDFNDTPLSYSVNHVGQGLQNAFQQKGKGWGVTYNGDFPNFQIDYILADTNFQVNRFEIITRKLSDHYPVWAELTFK